MELFFKEYRTIFIFFFVKQYWSKVSKDKYWKYYIIISVLSVIFLETVFTVINKTECKF